MIKYNLVKEMMSCSAGLAASSYETLATKPKSLIISKRYPKNGKKVHSGIKPLDK
jgi:hypothetical protein